MVALLPIWTSLLPVAIKAGLELFFIVAGPISGERTDVPGMAWQKNQLVIPLLPEEISASRYSECLSKSVITWIHRYLKVLVYRMVDPD